jgi:hypothetical protein
MSLWNLITAIHAAVLLPFQLLRVGPDSVSSSAAKCLSYPPSSPRRVSKACMGGTSSQGEARLLVAEHARLRLPPGLGTNGTTPRPRAGRALRSALRVSIKSDERDPACRAVVHALG